MSSPNRFRKLAYTNISSLRVSLFSAIVFNLVILFVVLVLVGLSVYGVSRVLAKSPTPTPTQFFNRFVFDLSKPTPIPTSTPLSTSTPFPTSTPLSTSTPFPTSTPLSTLTPFPTSTPLSTSTPFTFTIIYPSTPVPRLYNFHQLETISNTAAMPVVSSNFQYGFYRALCVSPDLSYIQPRIVGVGQKTGLIWRLWNEYDPPYKDELDLTYDTTFYLSDNSSRFHLALFWYADRVSDEIVVDFPGRCRSTQVIFIQASPPLADNVYLSSSIPVTVTQGE